MRRAIAIAVTVLALAAAPLVPAVLAGEAAGGETAAPAETDGAGCQPDGGCCAACQHAAAARAADAGRSGAESAAEAKPAGCSCRQKARQPAP